MKEMQFKILITAGMDGSLTGAIAKATSGLNRLKAAASGKVNFGENLSAKLKELQQAQASLERMKTLMRSGLGTTGGMRGLKEATLEVTRLRAALRSMQESGATKLEIKGVKEQLKWAEQNLKTAYANYGKQISELRQLQGALATAGVKANAFGDAEMKLRRTLDATNKALEAQKRLSEAYKAHNTAGENFNTAWDNMSNAVATAQSVMSPVIGATQTAMRYEAELSRSRALTQMDNINAGRTAVIEREMTMLDERYKEIGRTTRYSAIEAERAGNYLAMAGFTAEQINYGLKSMVNLGIANNTELDRTADIFSNIATSMRIEQTEAGYQKLADRTTYLTTHSNQTLTMLDDTMKYVAPIASAMKIDIDDLYSAQKFMVDSGVRGSMAGTALKSFILRSIAPSKKAMEALAEAGIMTPEEMNQNAAFQEMMMEAGIDVNARQGDESVLMSLIRQYSEKSKDWSDARKTSFIEAWAGKYAAPGVMAMLENGGYQKILEFNKGLKGSDGAAAQTAAVMNDNLQGSWLSLQSALEALSIEAGDAFVPAGRAMTDVLTSTVRSAALFASENRGLMSVLGGVVTAIGAAIAGLGAFRLLTAGMNFVTTTTELLKVTSAFRGLSGIGGVVGGLVGRFGGLSTVIGGVGRALAALAGPWGLALAAAATMVIANWDKVGPFFNNLAKKISGAFGKLKGVLGGLLDGTLFDKGFTVEGRERKERAGEIYREKTQLKTGEREKVQLATRSAARSSTDAKEIATALATELKTITNQTGARQDDMLKVIEQELSVRSDVSSETAQAVLTSVREELAGSRQDTNMALIESMTAALRAEQKDTLSGKLEEIFTSTQVTNVAQADRLASTLTAVLERDKSSDVTTKLEAVTSFLQSQTNIAENLRGEILGSIRDQMQTETTARIGEQVATAIKESTEQSALTEQLTSIMMAQEDRSSAAVEMMMTTVQSALEAGNTRSSEEISAVMEGLRESLSTAMEAQRSAASETFTQLQSKADDAGAKLELTGQMAQQLGLNSEQAGLLVQMLGDGAQAAGTSATDAAGNIGALGGAASEVANALAAKAGEIGSIAINVPQVNYMPVTMPAPMGAAVQVATNATGGIYPRGEFVTTFAEDSPEAAIPLDGSKRSESLWTKVGRMMGLLPEVKETPQPESIMSGSRVKLPFGLKIPPRRKTTPGVPTEVREPKGKLPEALERYESIDREMRTYSSAATATTTNEGAMTAPITVNITFNGAVDREETKTGVMEGLEEALARLTHERSRRSYA